MAYKAYQGIILKYNKSSDDARTCEVLQIPDLYVVSNVRLPQILSNQWKPKEKSVVMFHMEDSFKAYITTILREPKTYIKSPKDLRGGAKERSDQLEPGEIYFESHGDSLTPGFGSSLFLGNDGTIELFSGQRKEGIIIGGEETDEDGQIVLHADNMDIRSNIEGEALPGTPSLQSSFRFDDEHNITVANNWVVGGTSSLLETPLSELKMDNLGNVTLRNAIVGVDNSVIELNINGETVVKNTLGELKIDSLGAITLQNALGGFQINSTGNIQLIGPTIDFNNGSNGVARRLDTVTSNITYDPAYWTWMLGYFPLLEAWISTMMATGGTGAAKAALDAFKTANPYPSTLIGKITTASTTVTAGG